MTSEQLAILAESMAQAYADLSAAVESLNRISDRKDKAIAAAGGYQYPNLESPKMLRLRRTCNLRERKHQAAQLRVDGLQAQLQIAQLQASLKTGGAS